MVKDRAFSARDLLRERGLDAICFCHLPTIRYLCGFTGSDGVLVVGTRGAWFLTDSRYTTQAAGQVFGAEVRQYGVRAEGVGELLAEQGWSKVGFEAEALSVAGLERFKEKAPTALEWVPLTREAAGLRGCKDTEEVSALEEATELNAEAFAEVLPLIRPGALERDIALALEFALKGRGGEEKAFDFIVASGERGALPHGVASGKAIAAGELVTIDFGTRCRGYHSDETVTVAVGEVSSELRAIYDTVLEAHDIALAKIRPGVSLREVDGAARDFIASRGYGERFGHGLGHGVGLEVHEFPTVSTRSEESAREGMVFTVEPGVYVPGLGGVRIEDMVLVTAGGCRTLTRIPKAFRSLPA